MASIIIKIVGILIFLYIFTSLTSFICIHIRIKRNKLDTKRFFGMKEYERYIKVKNDSFISSVKYLIRMTFVFPKFFMKRKSQKEKNKYGFKHNNKNTITQCSCSGLPARYINPNLKEHNKNNKYKDYDY